MPPASYCRSLRMVRKVMGFVTPSRPHMQGGPSDVAEARVQWASRTYAFCGREGIHGSWEAKQPKPPFAFLFGLAFVSLR